MKIQTRHFIAALSVALAASHSPASVAATPTIYLQSATINGASSAVTLNRVPVQDAAGNISYKDIALGFLVDNAGNVTFNNAALKIAASPTLNVGAFKPGTYHGYRACSYADCAYTFKTGTPGVGTGGRISGSIARITSQGSGYDIFNATWTSGPVAGHPNQAQLNAAKITSTAYNWGVMGTAGGDTEGSGWSAGDIIGVIQNGNQLSIVNYGNDNIPDSTLSFDLCPTANAC